MEVLTLCAAPVHGCATRVETGAPGPREAGRATDVSPPTTVHQNTSGPIQDPTRNESPLLPRYRRHRHDSTLPVWVDGGRTVDRSHPHSVDVSPFPRGKDLRRGLEEPSSVILTAHSSLVSPRDRPGRDQLSPTSPSRPGLTLSHIPVQAGTDSLPCPRPDRDRLCDPSLRTPGIPQSTRLHAPFCVPLLEVPSTRRADSGTESPLDLPITHPTPSLRDTTPTLRQVRYRTPDSVFPLDTSAASGGRKRHRTRRTPTTDRDQWTTLGRLAPLSDSRNRVVDLLPTQIPGGGPGSRRSPRQTFPPVPGTP